MPRITAFCWLAYPCCEDDGGLLYAPDDDGRELLILACALLQQPLTLHPTPPRPLGRGVLPLRYPIFTFFSCNGKDASVQVSGKGSG